MEEPVPNWESSSQIGTNRVGRGPKNESEAITAMLPAKALKVSRISERLIHAKAIRRTAAYLQQRIGESELNALSIVSLWCWVHEREGGQERAIVHWSGYTKYWLAKTYAGIRSCIEIKWLEKIAVKNGYRLCIAPQGRRVIDIYSRMFDKVAEELRQQKIGLDLKRIAKAEKAKLIKELRESNMERILAA